MSTPGQRTYTDAVVPSGRTVSSFGTGEEAARKVRADQRLCWQKGQRVNVEDYLRWAPHLADEPEVLLDIVYSEYLLREEYGERPDPEQFVRRFPQFEAQLRRQFLLHAVLDDGTVIDGDGDAPTGSSDDEGERTIVSLPDEDPGITSIEDLPDEDGDRTVLSEYIEPEEEPAAPDLGPASTPEVDVVPRPSNSDTAHQPARRAALSKIKSALLTWPGADEVEAGAGQAFVAGYDILGELGRGAVGVVYKAKQRGLNRIVALKMILAGTHASRQTLARFRAEAEAVARLRHPNIVQIYDIGQSDGLPYFSLEFCPGGPLSGHLDGTPLAGDEAARIVETLARAMHYAHEHGIVHRDLKPANVLVAGECDVRTGALRQSANLRSGEWGASMTEVHLSAGLKIADFGLAKRLDESSQTKTGAVLGTPSYMAPEQASGHIHDVTPLADVYALGAILYELLTGRPPFRAATAIDTVVQVLNEEPVPPRRLQSRVPEDLETITLKCLEKDKAKRYHSAEALAEDLARYLKREPILARPVGPAGRAIRWCRRNPVVASLIGLAAVLLVGGTAVSMAYAHQASVQKGIAEANAATAKQESINASVQKGIAEDNAAKAQAARVNAIRNFYFAQMNLAQRAWEDVQMARLRDLLDNQRPERTGIDLRGFEWHYWDRKARAHLASCEGHDGKVERVAYSPNGRTLATGGSDRVVRLWSAADGSPLFALTGHTGPLVGVAFLPDGRLATASAAVNAESANVAEIFVWDLATRQTVFRVATVAIDQLEALAVSPDGARLATASSEGVRLWDARDGTALPEPDGANGHAVGVAYAADGALAAGFEGGIRVWAANGGEPTQLSTPKPKTIIQGLAFSPDGKRLYAGGGEQDDLNPELSRVGFVAAWDRSSREMIRKYDGRFARVFALGISPDGATVVGVSDDAALRFWDATEGKLMATTQGHGGPVNGIAVAPDGRRVATASDDGTARTWDARPWEEPAFAPSPQFGFRAFAHLPGGRIATGGFTDGEKTVPWLATWDTETGRPLVKCDGLRKAPKAIAFTAAGGRERLASLDDDGAVQLFDGASGKLVGEMPLRDRNFRSLTFLPDGRLAAFRDTLLVAWDGDGPHMVLRNETGKDRLIKAIKLDDDGRLLAAISVGRKVVVESVDGGSVVTELVGHTDQVNAIAFSHDGKSVATGSYDRTARLWDLPSGQLRHTLRGHTNEVEGLAFDVGGTRLVTAGRGYDASARVWDTMTGQEVLSLLPGGDALAFSPDGLWLGAVGIGGLRLWDARPETPERSTRREAIQILKHFADAATARAWLDSDPPVRREARDDAAKMVERWFRDAR